MIDFYLMGKKEIFLTIQVLYEIYFKTLSRKELKEAV